VGLGYLSAHLLDLRETCGQKATSPSVANSGRPVANEPDNAIITVAIVAARANFFVAKRIDDPVPNWGQFDTNYFQDH
jgi:hypothetical protein